MSPALTSCSVSLSDSPLSSLPAFAVQLKLFNAVTKSPALTSLFLLSSVTSATLPFGLVASPVAPFTVSVVVSATIPLVASTFKPSAAFTSYLTVIAPLAVSLVTDAVVPLPLSKVTFVPDATVSKLSPA